VIVALLVLQGVMVDERGFTLGICRIGVPTFLSGFFSFPSYIYLLSLHFSIRNLCCYIYRSSMGEETLILTPYLSFLCVIVLSSFTYWTPPSTEALMTATLVRVAKIPIVPFHEQLRMSVALANKVHATEPQILDDIETHIHVDMRALEAEFLDLGEVETQIKNEIAEAIWDDLLREVMKFLFTSIDIIFIISRFVLFLF
jgi:hypothetical protein